MEKARQTKYSEQERQTLKDSIKKIRENLRYAHLPRALASQYAKISLRTIENDPSMLVVSALGFRGYIFDISDKAQSKIISERPYENPHPREIIKSRKENGYDWYITPESG